MSPKRDNISSSKNPRDLLVEWANIAPEWARYIVRNVIDNKAPLNGKSIATAYKLFLQENGLEERTLPDEPLLIASNADTETIAPLTITSLSDVIGVNALGTGNVIKPDPHLTILFGENGTGKTGYSRIFKALADSRTVDKEILGNIAHTQPEAMSATIKYRLGDNDEQCHEWHGEKGVPPFTRMSIFDSRAVKLHVDDDLDYTYTPAVLALFEHVTTGVKSVQEAAKREAGTPSAVPPDILSRFDKNTSVYQHIVSLSAATDLAHLKSMAVTDPEVNTRIESQSTRVAELESNTIKIRIRELQRTEQALSQACEATRAIEDFDVDTYEQERQKLKQLEENYRLFRVALFKEADLPMTPDDTWMMFIESAERYRQHLDANSAYDTGRCLYCRQPLQDAARTLIEKYAELLEDKISADINSSKERLKELVGRVTSTQLSDAKALIQEHADSDDKPAYYAKLERIMNALEVAAETLSASEQLVLSVINTVSVDGIDLKTEFENVTQEREQLQDQDANRSETLQEEKHRLSELVAAVELAKSWASIEEFVNKAQWVAGLKTCNKQFPSLIRRLTNCSKQANKQIVDNNFDALFSEECRALRAPEVKVNHIGRQGRAQRNRLLVDNYKPSTVFSEGEQKVLAMADFLAEARLSGVTAPVIFDDPVSSLDHRRVGEVAERVAALSETAQVIVFTHDIFFTTTLLQIIEDAKRTCTYFQISDENGKGFIMRGSHPQWDSISKITKLINSVVQKAKSSKDSDERNELVQRGYSLIRSWCEVFVETEVFAGVTLRYQPNVRLNCLSKVKADSLPEVIEVVSRVFRDSCRYIDSHSQPLVTLGTRPTATTLENDWGELQAARSNYRNG
ncbi:AAA family ATPase [Actinomyces johnsonii]|uniref:AAA family ATPase n=1 Tax=Actinomyces johnsonii TaxID=544581 RepID=A0A508ABT4_9ACTO|nr:AAA family ATPase [Actinomyces johnsonii]KAA8743145.1 AAA family ATPase [Actinomyces johnsonii]TQD44495.1 AAA family ATPase [Actinomyces johnsonii]